MLLLRLPVVVGAVAYVVGGWVGWREGPVPYASPVRAHELAGVVGEWAWLGAAPMLAASMLPFARGWLRWLWLAAVGPLGFAVVAWRYPESAPGYPFFPSPEDPHRGLWLSLMGSLVVLVALLLAFVLARRGPGDRATRGRPLLAVAVFVAVLVGVVVIRGSRDEAAERRVRMSLQGELRGKPDIKRLRVECRDRLGRPPRCAWEIEYTGGSSEGGVGEGASYVPGN